MTPRYESVVSKAKEKCIADRASNWFALLFVWAVLVVIVLLVLEHKGVLVHSSVGTVRYDVICDNPFEIPKTNFFVVISQKDGYCLGLLSENKAFLGQVVRKKRFLGMHYPYYVEGSGSPEWWEFYKKGNPQIENK